MLRALDEMQGKLRTQIETERAVAAENTRIRQALDKASTSVVLADEKHQIIYLNDIAQASFTRNAQEIRTTLPNFDATRLRGSGLESLSPDPASQRRVLDNLTSADVQERVLGDFTFRTVTNPVIGERGERLGTVMEWSQRTQEVRVEKELQTMLSAINGGNLGKRIDLAGKNGFFEAMSRGINQLADNITATVSMVKSAAARDSSRRAGNLRGQLQPVAAYGRAGGLARRDRILDGRDDHDRQAERRQRRPGESTRPRRARPGRARRHGRRQSRAGDVGHQ